YNTAHRAVTILRMAILAHSEDADILLSGEIELDESCFGGKRGRGAAGKVPVFGILSRGSQVFVQVVPDCKAETLLGLTVKKVRRGSIVYTDKYKVYDALMCCGYRHLAVDHGKCFSNGKVYINGLEGFWSFAKERLIKHHGVSRKFFPLYLKELEFRYNYRQHNLFNKLCQFLCDFAPDVE
ncbi:MAG: IS1595 family transposase, partial [Thermovirgaceae bacterium]